MNKMKTVTSSVFEISKFDPETDPSRPVVGSVHEYTPDDGRPSYQFLIERVSWVETSKLLSEIIAAGTGGMADSMALDGHDECFCQPHPTRPHVQWLVWAKRL